MKKVKLCIAISTFFVFIFMTTAAAQIDITIDIKPNAINPLKNGLITVAIITDTEFDATTVDPLSVLFGPDGATEKHDRGHIEDADNDGDLDLVLHFSAKDTGIQCGATSASLTGKTFDDESIQGSDAITTAGNCAAKNYRKGPIPPKELCLLVPGANEALSLVLQSSNAIKFRYKKEIHFYAIQGAFGYDDFEIVFPVDGSGFMENNLFHFHLNGTYYDADNDTMINNEMEGTVDFTEDPASGSMGILVSDVDGNSQMMYPLAEVPCSDMDEP